MVLSRLVYPLLIPSLILSLAIWFRANIVLLPETYLPLLGYLPYALFIVSSFLCLQFNQLRSQLIAIILIIAYWVVQLYLQVSLQEISAVNAYFLLSIILPLLLLTSSWLPEKGIITRFGLLLFLIISLPAVIAVYFYLKPEQLITALIYFPLNAWSFSILSPLAIIIYLLAIVHQLCRLWFFQQPLDAAISVLLTGLLINFVRFDQNAISIVVFIAAQLIMIWAVLKHSHDMAYRDELTGLPGRRALNESLKSPGRKYVLAMIDIDHFKKFNDKYGHDVGDDVLKAVASKMALISGGGTAYRYGGEEFTVLFKGKEVETCIPHLQALREEIAHYDLSIREKANRPKTHKEGKKQRGNRRKPKAITVTISIGVAKRSVDVATAEQILKAADKALYKAKQAGRNCLISHNQ